MPLRRHRRGHVTEPDRAVLVRLLRAKARELEGRFRLLVEAGEPGTEPPELVYLIADVALIADLTAHLFDTPEETR